MKIVSFDDSTNKIKRDPKQDNLFNLFQKNVVYQNLSLYIYIVPREYEMRLDRISNHIYGTTDYVEELMVLNNIINPYSVKEGQEIYFCDISSLQLLYTTDIMSDDNEIKRQELINSNQSIENQSVSTDKNLPPNIKPKSLNQIVVTDDNQIQIINSFK